MAFLSTSWFRTISKFPSSAPLLRGSSPGGRSPSGRRAARPSFTGGLFCCRCGRFRALVQTPSKRDRILCGIPPPDPATDGRSCLHGHGRRVRRGWLSKSEAVRDCHRLRFGSGAPTGYALYPVESQLLNNPQQLPGCPSGSRVVSSERKAQAAPYPLRGRCDLPAKWSRYGAARRFRPLPSLHHGAGQELSG